MATTASSSSRTGRTLPLIDCPKCKVPVVKCKSKNENVYYRCPNNVLNDDKCSKFWFEDAYELYLRDNPHLLENSSGVGHNPSTAVQVVQQTPGTAVQGIQPAPGEMQMVALDLKMQLGDIKLEIGNLRTEIKELKDEVMRGKNPIVVDNAAVVCILLAMFAAVLVASVWKK